MLAELHARHSNENVCAKYTNKLVQKFQATGGNKVVDEMVKIEVLGNFGMTPTRFLRSVAAVADLS